VVLIALLVVAVALITIDFRDGGDSSAHGLGGRVFGPIEHLAGDATGVFRGAGNGNEIANLQKQNDQLRAQLAQHGESWPEFRESIRDEITIQRLRQRFAQTRISVSDAEVDAALEASAGGQQYHLANILVALPEGATPEQIATWDLHATATPGDYREVETLRGVVPDQVLVTARKGTFGHGMSAGGGWELTAQYLGYAGGHLFPTLLTESSLNPAIAGVHGQFVFADTCAPADGLAGKLSSGIGGINACVISRPLPKDGE